LALHGGTLFERLSECRAQHHHAGNLLWLEKWLDRLLTFNLGAKIYLNLPGHSVSFKAAAAVGSLVHINLSLASACIANSRLIRLRTDSGLRVLAVLELIIFSVGVG
jgi:hypothetical protein